MAQTFRFLCRTLIASFLASLFLQGHDVPKAQAQSEPPELKWSGDLRYRFVNLKEEPADTRLYQQLRARLGVTAKIQEDLSAVVRLATASSAISNNQTLGDSKEPGMPRRSFGIDLAYGQWSFLENGRFWLGRSPNPFFAPGKTQLVFDSDLAFEGGSVSWRPSWGDSSGFATLGGFIISENYASPRDEVDTGLVGAEIGYALKTELGQWTLRAARFHYLNIIDRPITSVESGAKIDTASKPFDRYRGNSVYLGDPLAPPADRRHFFQFDFVQTELGLEWTLKTEDLEFMAYADGIANERASHAGTAFEFGASLKHGRAQLLLAHALKRSDSVIGAFSDSDFNGGGTDNRGFKLSFTYELSSHSNVVLTHYQAQRGINSTERDYKAQQLDFSLMF